MECLLFLCMVVYNFINTSQIQLEGTRENTKIYVHKYQILRNVKQKRNF
jgi:hypothetical protein